MSDNWKSYFCSVNGKLASIFFDFGIRQTVPDEGRSWLLWVWVYFKQPRPDGLSSREEFETLVSLEDSLVAALEQRCRAVLSGRITTAGRREFYFYGARPEDFNETVRQSMSSFRGYRFDLDKQHDPAWAQYLNVIYPSEEQLELIANRDLLDALSRKGDTLESPREVRHWAYFSQQTDRANFRAMAETLGYRIESESEGSHSKGQYGICIVKIQEMTLAAIDDAVTELFRACKSSYGDYDGWECQLIVGAAQKEKSRWKFW